MVTLKSILKVESDLAETTSNKNKQIRAEKERIIGNMLLRCAGNAYGSKSYKYGCGKSSQLRSWTLEMRLYWDNNTGSPNGGFFAHGGDDTDSLICPKCSKHNYIYNHPDRQKIMDMRTLIDDSWPPLNVFAAVTEKESTPY